MSVPKKKYLTIKIVIPYPEGKETRDYILDTKLSLWNLLCAVTGLLVFTLLLGAIAYFVSRITRPERMVVKVQHADIRFISSARGVEVFPKQFDFYRSCLGFKSGCSSWWIDGINDIGDWKEVIFVGGKNGFGFANGPTLDVGKNLYSGSPLKFQGGRLSEIGVMGSYGDGFWGIPGFVIHILMPVRWISDPDDWTLVNSKAVPSVSKAISGIVGLNSEIADSEYSNYREGKSKNYNPPLGISAPIWYPSQPSPARGWIICAIGTLGWWLGLWVLIFLTGYQFHMKRIGWGFACIFFGLLTMGLSTMLIGHGISLTLRPVPWQ